jgi:hypothetical protein
MGIIKKCLHQIIRPTAPNTPVEGVGDCEICEPNEDNKLCKKYYPINKFNEFEVKEKEKCHIQNKEIET